MSYIDVTGKTEEEAIRKALAQLGMDRDDVSVEILERAKSGFLGIGGHDARVRVTYGPEEAPMEEIPLPVKPVKKAEEKSAKKAEKPVKAARPKPVAEEKPIVEEKAAEAPCKEALPVCEDDNAKRIAAFLSGLLAHMDSAAQVKVYETEKGRYKAILEGEKMGALIGRRGETLDAI